MGTLRSWSSSRSARPSVSHTQGSNWSKVNIPLAERLTAQGRMRPPGLAAFERRESDQVCYSYERDGGFALPDAYEVLLRVDPPLRNGSSTRPPPADQSAVESGSRTVAGRGFLAALFGGFSRRAALGGF